MQLTICARSYDHGKNKIPVLYFSQCETMKVPKISHKIPYICNTLIPYNSDRLNREKRATGKKRVAQLSRPWSKSSPSGVEDPVRRACLPSMPSKWCDRNWVTNKTNQSQRGIQEQRFSGTLTSWGLAMMCDWNACCLRVKLKAFSCKHSLRSKQYP